MSSKTLYLKDAYLKEEKAFIKAVSSEFGIELDRSIFYPRGGGQPGDQGLLRLLNKNIEIVETIKGPNGEINLIPSNMDDLVELKKGDEVVQELDWQKRFKYMRTHTALHLLSVCLPFPVTGGQITFEKGRLDFDIPEAPDKEELEKKINDLISADYIVSYSSISQEELRKNPEMVKTMSVKPPTNTDFVRLVRIGDDNEIIDLQPCGGTHVSTTSEIGVVTISKVEKKGRLNMRVSVILQD